MDTRTLTALQGSIAKWEAIVNTGGEDKAASNCPLCIEFMADDCKGCPVAGSTKNKYCNDTPYDAWVRGVREVHRGGAYRATTPELIVLAQAELDFLRDLLPSDTDTDLPIREIQPGVFNRPAIGYTYVGPAVDGLHIFRCDEGARELFAERDTPHAGWHLRRGDRYYEFVREARITTTAEVMLDEFIRLSNTPGAPVLGGIPIRETKEEADRDVLLHGQSVRLVQVAVNVHEAAIGMPVFQYEDPNVPENPDCPEDGYTARWIVAGTEAEADAYARQKGWRQCGGNIFTYQGEGGVDVFLAPRGEFQMEPSATIIGGERAPDGYIVCGMGMGGVIQPMITHENHDPDTAQVVVYDRGGAQQECDEINAGTDGGYFVCELRRV